MRLLQSSTLLSKHQHWQCQDQLQLSDIPNDIQLGLSLTFDTNDHIESN